MAVLLSGNGNIFQKLGNIAGGLADVIALEGGTATARVLSGASWTTRGTTLETDYAYSPVMSQTLDGVYSAISSWRGGQQGLMSAMQALAQATVIKQVDLDASLPQKTLVAALTELIRQMISSSDSLNASTVAIGAQTAQGSPNGTPIFVFSTKNGAGLVGQTVLAETLRVAVTGDSQGSATLRQEPFSVLGAAPADSVFAFDWPKGSACNVGSSLVDAQKTNSAGNKLANGSFEAFTTANYADCWLATVGTIGTTILNGGSSNSYTGSGSLEFLGDGGSTLSAMTQQFGLATSTSAGAGGTPATLTPLSQYALNCWIKCTATPAAGVLEFSLVDGSGTTIADAQSVNNLFTKSLTAVSTSWVNVNGVFRTPALLPSTVKLKVRLSTAIDSAKGVFIDDLALTQMTPIYAGGPQMAGFAGATKVLAGDTWTFTVTNTMGALAAWMEKLFSLRALGLQFPYSGSPTVADSLVA